MTWLNPLALAVTPFEWKGHRVTLLDTPGDPDFRRGDGLLMTRNGDSS